MSKHTPGPWKDVVNDDGYLIVKMDDAHTVVLGDMESTCETCHANANLIAAAPELLQALELAVRFLDHPETKAIPFAFPVDGVITSVRAAIAKAKGTQS